MLLLLFTCSASAAILPGRYSLDAQPDADGRMPSNSIIDIKPHGETIWFGTGRGLAQLYLDGSGFAIIKNENGIGRGGVSAVAITDSIIWAATAYSEKVQDTYYPAGGGVGYSRDGGINWTWMDQPVDPPDVVDYSPTTTNIQNVTYDIALSASAVWISSWGGGLRRMRYDNNQWELVTPDGESFSALLHLNHRAFSAVYAYGTLFIGTAAGINRTSDEGMSWELSAFQLEALSISGNFVTALAAQDLGGRANIWAATWKAEGAYEYYGVSVSEDYGASWGVALSDSTILSSGDYLVDRYGPLRAHNFGFKGDTVYVAADKGLWISHDNGFTWGDAPLDSIYDPTISEYITGADFFSVAQVGDSLWVGTDAGLAVGWFDQSTGSFTWRIHRSHQPAGRDDQPDTYAYPNPFSPRRGQFTRFQIAATQPIVASFGIWNFAMEPVFKSGQVVLSGSGTEDMTGYGALRWDGKNSEGRTVANGVYFYRVKADDNTWWGKIMVLD